ncbi:hypothetical protein I2I11_14290 [Pontibacter sp. 172403-2]|uniref:hypothetical protein n=1 Tax=Pontibacter rufus TaxID=2791028 RepID=UPI0018AF6FD3|nr:hypothetical protein [Pontibacter sp. 172403-2]MBF9254470.1 hypothetical protein [Pontibacter sp. 172403-2]
MQALLIFAEIIYLSSIEATEKQGIGQRNERSLHASLKQWCARPGDRFEVPVGTYIIDLVRGEQLIEIQTRNFTAIRHKLGALLRQHKVHLLHPVTSEKWIVQVDAGGDKILSRRKSPFKGRLTDVFEELVRIPGLLLQENFSLEILLIKEEEVRCRDGKGSKHRKRESIKDRRLVEVVETHRFNCPGDFMIFLPSTLPQPFSNKDLASALQLPLHRCRQITYTLRKMEAICLAGKNRNELLFRYAGN